MILKEVIDIMTTGLQAVGKNDYIGLKICELGDQRMKWVPEGTGKKYLLARGVTEHVSIDMNGKNGALRLDLSKPINNEKEGDKWYHYFDMVTNFGTAEHVQDGIYECFKNIHNFVKVNGVMINDGPPTGGCPWHSPYHYDPDFFSKLAKLNNYECVLTEVRVMPEGIFRGCADIHKSLVCAALVKRVDTEFCTKEEFMNLNAIEGL